MSLVSRFNTLTCEVVVVVCPEHGLEPGNSSSVLAWRDDSTKRCCLRKSLANACVQDWYTSTDQQGLRYFCALVLKM